MKLSLGLNVTELELDETIDIMPTYSDETIDIMPTYSDIVLAIGAGCAEADCWLDMVGGGK